MSVSQQQKLDIISQNYKSSCCRRALLCGVLFASGRADDTHVSISVEKNDYAVFIEKLVHEFYGRHAEIVHPKSGGRCVSLTFNSISAAKYIANITSVKTLFTKKCNSCLSAFLRGVFLASGRISDPKKQFSLEFTLFERSEIFASFLKELSLTPLISHRKDRDTVYFRKSSEIEDFHAYAGLNNVVFDIIEAKIETLARRTSQRYLNCVTNNYKKMADVSERQIEMITRLDELNLLSSLPEELENTARMRMRYSDLPLGMLAAQMVPSISKSGLSHRLKRIEEIGAKLLEKDKLEE